VGNMEDDEIGICSELQFAKKVETHMCFRSDPNNLSARKEGET